MELKRILAKDIRRATEKAVALYGKDVLFVSNSLVNGMTEVIVAVEVMPDPPLELSNRGNGALFLSALDQSFKALENGATASAAPVLDEPLEKVVGAGVAADAADQRDYIRGREIVDMVRDELTAIRKEFKLAQRVAMWQSESTGNQAVRPLVAALAEAGIPVSLRTLMVDHISEMDNLQQAQEALQAHLVNSIGLHSAKLPQTGVHAIAGPAGAGKTLMVARLARAAAERKGAEAVAVISYCDQRAGAWSQIQMLCAQIGVDCLRANDADTLKLLLGELGSRKLVLIDTAGVEVVARANEVAACAKNINCHLLLPADATATTVRKHLLDPSIQWQSLMLSRMDESTQPWALIQILCEHQVPLSAASFSALTGEPAKALSANQLVGLAIQSLGIDETVAAYDHAIADEPAMTVLTAAQALVQRIEKMPHATS
jgi:flagellar biosynthesis protein FlhF